MKFDFDKLAKADVVFAVEPDGTKTIIKGERFLKQIVDSDIAQDAVVRHVDVECWEDVEALAARFDRAN